MNAQKGYTFVELLIVIATVATLAMFVGGLYTMIHFIQKFW